MKTKTQRTIAGLTLALASGLAATGTSATYTYDLNNNLIEATDAKGQKVVNTWGYGHLLNTQSIKILAGRAGKKA